MRSRLSHIVRILAVLYLIGPGEAQADSNRYPAHYLVLEMAQDGSIDPVFHRFVELAAPPRSLNDKEFQAAKAADEPPGSQVALQLLNSHGQVIFQDLVQVPRSVRGEFRGKARSGSGWEYDGHRFPLPLTSFVVRLPRIEETSLVIEGLQRTVLDLDRVAAEADLLPLSRGASSDQPAIADLLPTGNPANRVDLLIMGDGYTAEQEGNFDADAAVFAEEIFDITPYSDYRSHVNVTTLFTVSPQSGADHPPYDPECTDQWTCCADPRAASDPLAGTFVDTAYHGRFCANNIHVLLVVNFTYVLMAASAVPDWDMIVVLVNDPTYGGSGGGMSVTSTHPDGVPIVQHEYGHSFTGLADEYDAPYPGFPPCSDIVGPACEVNVTDETIRSLIKWRPWIDVSTPIPTPEEDPEYVAAVGLFEGARYHTTGMYRPRDYDCLMHHVGVPCFCEICAQEYVLRLYRGGWGTPELGIDPIEPGSEDPSPGALLAPSCGLTMTVELLQPTSGPPLEVAWWVDGVPVAGENGESYLFIPPELGIYQVRVRVEDPTPLVHPAMAGMWLQSLRQWTVNVYQSDPPGQPISIHNVRLTTDGNDFAILDFGDANPSSDVTGYNVYRSSVAGLDRALWPLVAADVTDELPDPGLQWVDRSGMASPTDIWYYDLAACNSACNAEGPR